MAETAIITGANSGIGRATAMALAGDGFDVGFTHLDDEAGARETAAEIEAHGRRCAHRALDLTDPAAGPPAIDALAEELDGVDVLVNNAGMVSRKFFLQTKPAEWRRQIDVGLYGVLNCCHLIAPGMVERKHGRIVNIAGDSARVGQAQLGFTAAARGGVLSLTRTLARELGRASITVNAVSFGWIETGHIDPAFWEANREKILQQYAIKRLGRPDDVAPAVAFLASDAAAWITGQTLSISGGYTTI
jgi:2-hydroxycyclohexanecarboxyl-CoA dehydrogenase